MPVSRRLSRNFLADLLERGDTFGAQHFLGLLLGFFPGRNRLFEQPLALSGQPERLGASVLARAPLPASLGTHPLDVATERGNIELQQIADLGSAGRGRAWPPRPGCSSG